VPIGCGMNSSTERKPEGRRYERWFLRNVFAAAFVGVGLGLVVAGASVVDALVIGVVAAAILALGFMACGLFREG
jgi:hypothetical protein